MKNLLKSLEKGKAQLSAHPFYHWVKTSPIPFEKKLMFIPIMIHFVMNFRDMNRWVIRFENDQKNPFKQTINNHTLEDETHSKLFLEDWHKLHMDDKTNWQPKDLLWWLFLAPNTETIRQCGAEYIRLAVEDRGDPLVRYAHAETVEICGRVFFECISPLADALGKAKKLNYRYFGLYHFAREKGSMIDSEALFHQQTLTLTQQKRAQNLAHRMFELFFILHDAFFDYIQQYVETNTLPRPSTAPNIQIQPITKIEVPNIKTAFHPNQQTLQTQLNNCKKKAEAHPFYQHLRTNPLPAKQKLQRFIPLWAFDILGYRDLNQYGFRYPNPQTHLEYHINQQVDNFITHSQLFLTDWEALGMDKALCWVPSQLLDFLYFDHGMNVHRKHLIGFMKLAIEHDDPVERLYFIQALEASGEAFFNATATLAKACEKTDGIVLNYLGNQHSIYHPHPHVQPLEILQDQPINKQQCTHIQKLIETVFQALDQNLNLSFEAVLTNKFAIQYH